MTCLEDFTVLMEPKWNVKSNLLTSTMLIPRINGTKVECKGARPSCIAGSTFVLMEPKWNVKQTKLSDDRKRNVVLMEPKWNVKLCKLVYL